jgi:hypothetical protein|tara:strand:+ start:215 stop:568 length:354 start_codon:yes stop_codon:yes gene_type:complete
MATLTPTLTLNSADATSDTVNFSVTDTLNVTGDVVSLSRVALSTSDLTLFASASYSRSYVYLKNTDSSIAMDIDFGTTASFNLAAGEFAFFPWHGSQNILAVADSGTPVLEYALWEA